MTDSSSQSALDKCISALEDASTDTEKFSILFIVPKLLKEELDKTSKFKLMEAIGFSFIARMLRSKDTPEGCPKLMYQSVALSILGCFTEDDIINHPSILFNLPVLLDIVNDSDNEIYEENLLLIRDAYQVLSAIVSTKTGRKSFISHRGVHYLCEIIIRQNFEYEQSLNLLLPLLKLEGQSCWSYHSSSEDFNNLMNKYCREFNDAQDETKFELCEIIDVILSSSTTKVDSKKEAPKWISPLQNALKHILFSKIGKQQRDPAVRLVATLVENSNFEWCLNIDDQGKFLMILLNLTCIEVIMHLEEKKIADCVDESEMLISCFIIMEHAIGYLVCEKPSPVMNQDKKGQLYTAVKNAFIKIVGFIQENSQDTEVDFKDPKAKGLLCAIIRVLGTWLSEETMAIREDVYEILKFILEFSVMTFESQKLVKLSNLPGRNFNENTILKIDNSNSTTPDTLRFLLPGLCHLVTEDKSREIIMNLKMYETLHTYLSYHWSIYESYRNWLSDQAEANEIGMEVTIPQFMIDHAKNEMTDSKYAMTTLCNIFMNICVLEPKFVNRTPLFFLMLKFIINVIPILNYSEPDTMVLYGNLAMLGLLILKHHEIRRPKESDVNYFKFIQGTVRFLWDAFNCEESDMGDELEVSTAYLMAWNEIADIWFLGMQVIISLLDHTNSSNKELSWLAEFLIESGWHREIILSLTKVKRNAIDDGTKSAYEDFLCALFKHPDTQAEIYQELKKNDIVSICKKHKLGILAKLITNKVVSEQRNK